jgi:hypothetical protein
MTRNTMIMVLMMVISIFSGNLYAQTQSEILKITPYDSTPIGDREPLLLIHGWNWDGLPAPPYLLWDDFLNYYNARNDLKSNFKVYTVGYWSNLVSVKDLGTKLKNEIELNTDISSKPISIMAHSMGGLVSRSLMNENTKPGGGLYGEKIKKLITLGTPHRGTFIANGPARDEKLGFSAGLTAAIIEASIDCEYNQINRTCMHWDNYDNFLNLNNRPDETNTWLINLNQIEQFRSKMIMYYGDRIYGTSDLDTMAEIMTDLGYNSDGVVPVASASFDGYNDMYSVKGYLHYQHEHIVTGKDFYDDGIYGYFDHNYFTQITSDLLDDLTGNPSVFAAVGVGSNQINLSWNKNYQNNDVLVAFSQDGVFGNPSGTYSTGQNINGGGTVVFNGGGTSFSHLGLNPETTYYYMAWSIKTGQVYSSGTVSHSETLSSSQSAYLFENFNASSQLPSGWSIIDRMNNGQVWKFGTLEGGLTGTSGNYAYLNSNGYGTSGQQDTDLITPPLDLTGSSDVKLKFTHYYLSFPGQSGTLSYSIGNSNSWTQIAQLTTMTANPSYFDQSIPGIIGQTGVRFKWTFTGADGNSWSIDDVSVTGTVATPGVPTAVTGNPTDITTYSAVFNGSVIAGLSLTSVFFEYGTTTAYGMTINGNPVTVDGSVETPVTATLSNLSNNTTYNYRIKAVNSSGTTYGLNQQFTTYDQYVPVTILNETFETNSPTLSGWSQIQVSGTKSWTYATGAGTGSVTTAKNGSRNARFTGSSGGGVTKLVTPVINLEGYNSPKVTFWYAQELWAPDQNELKVYYRTTAGGTWSQIAHYIDNTAVWTNAEINLPNASSTYQIAFEGLDKYGYPNVIDDVIVIGGQSVNPTVTSPLNVIVSASSSSAHISWNTVSGAVKYNVYRSVDPYGNFVKIGETVSLTYTDTNIQTGSRFFYYVTASN